MKIWREILFASSLLFGGAALASDPVASLNLRCAGSPSPGTAVQFTVTEVGTGAKVASIKTTVSRNGAVSSEETEGHSHLFWANGELIYRFHGKLQVDVFVQRPATPGGRAYTAKVYGAVAGAQLQYEPTYQCEVQ